MNEIQPTLTISCKVVGVSYENRPAILERMSRARDNGDDVFVRLRPEPDNKFDPNAVAVDVSLYQETLQVGYIAASIAKELAPHLEGENLMISIEELVGGFEMRDGSTAAFGLRIRIELPVRDGADTTALRRAVEKYR